MGGRPLTVILVERQVHGYRQGHQLLAASAQLPKEDQSVVDRLSDVAGPLRPRERFQSYLTAYPLPSGEHFVLARTWQDLKVARAGCVRTLSLIIPMTEWTHAEGLSAFLDLVRTECLPDDRAATTAMVQSGPPLPVLAVDGFHGSELMEALFLEESRPVVVLGAADPDLIAIRLLTALWPSLRRRFALSTFALSPRKIAGREFDLVFAPKDARSKFTDWNGRRVDGRSTQISRHRWTGAIVSRVFDQPFPRLLSPVEIRLVGGGDADVDSAAALRIALLWDELVAKLDTTPAAALGLLDIANSGKVNDSFALDAIEPALAGAARRVASSLPEGEAWSFLGAIARKLHVRQMTIVRNAVAEVVEQLAGRSPEGAIALLSQEDSSGSVADLVPRIAAGIGGTFTNRSKLTLLEADPTVLGRLLAHCRALVAKVADDPELVAHLGRVLKQLDDSTLDVIGRDMLPLLTDDWQITAAEPLLARLDGPQLMMELRHLGTVSHFGSQLSGLVLDRALSEVPREDVRSALAALSESEGRDVLIARTLLPVVEDVRWLVNCDGFNPEAASAMLLNLLRQADDHHLASIVVDSIVGGQVIDMLREHAPERLLPTAAGDALPLRLFVQVAPKMLEILSGARKVQFAKHILRRSLGHRFGDDEVEFLASALSVVGDQLDGAWAARLGLSKNVNATIASRNMVAFRKATQPARQRIVWSIAEVAQVLRDRPRFDLDEAAVKACAAFMVDAEKVTPSALLTASGHLLPTLLRSRNRPVSPMIASAFPAVHRELAKADSVTDVFKFIPFIEWDRCKAARQELVDAFMSSTWPPRDLVLTACRADQVVRITRRVAKQPGGENYMMRIASDLRGLPEKCRRDVESAIAQIRSNPAVKYDWRE